MAINRRSKEENTISSRLLASDWLRYRRVRSVTISVGGLPVPYHGKHLLEAGVVALYPGNAVVIQKQGIAKALFCRIVPQHFLLVLYAQAGAFPAVLVG